MLNGRYFPCGCWQSFMADTFGQVELCPEHRAEEDTMSDRAFAYLDDQHEWRWVRKAANGQIVAASTEGYRDKVDALANYRRVSGEGGPLLELLHEDEEATT